MDARRRPVGLPATRQAFSLVDVERYESVLAASARAHEGPGGAALLQREEDAASREAGEPRPPQTLKRAKDGATASPRRPVRPRMPPVGIAARADVDIYRYSQAAEQRMRIRPLFESRHELGAAVTTAVAQDDESEEEGEAGAFDTEGILDLDSQDDGLELDQEHEAPLDLHDAMVEPATEASTNLDTTTDVFCSDDDIVNVDECTDAVVEGNIQIQVAEDDVVAPAMNLTLANCHEPFITDNFTVIEAVRFATHLPSKRVRTQKPICEVASNSYKKIWHGACTVRERQIDVALVLSSEGDVCVACGDIGSNEPTIITLSDAELAKAKELRGDLVVMSDEWASWLASRLLQREDGSFHIDLGNVVHEVENQSGTSSMQHIFSKALLLSSRNGDSDDREVCVEVFLHQLEERFTVRVGDKSSKATTEIHLSNEEVLNLAALMSLVDANNSEESPEQKPPSVNALAVTSEFLEGLCQSNIIRLAIETLEPSSSSGAEQSVANVCEDYPLSTSDYVTLRQMGLSPNPVINSDGEWRASNPLTSIAILAKAHADDRIHAAIRTLSQQAAIQMHSSGYIARTKDTETGDLSFQENVCKLMDAAQEDRLHRLAFSSILDDLVINQLRVECGLTLQQAKHSSEFQDHYATKLQATFRMSKQRRAYRLLQHKRMVAARMIQTRHRGSMVRCRYRILRVQDEQFQLLGFAESKPQFRHLHKDISKLDTADDAARRVRLLEMEEQRQRVGHLMQIICGSSTNENNAISYDTVQHVLGKFGILAGHGSGLDEDVANILHGIVKSDNEDSSALVSRNQISAALLLALRVKNDSGLWDLLPEKKHGSGHKSQTAMQASMRFGRDHNPPRWALKANIAIRRTNRERQDRARLVRHKLAIEAAGSIAVSYRRFLDEVGVEFEESRRIWAATINAEDRRVSDAQDSNKLTQRCLDLLLLSIRGNGVDPEHLLEALNLCYRSSHGQHAVTIAEQKFNRLALSVAAGCEYVQVLPLRDEIEQELGEFDRLLALRCLDIAAHGENYCQLVPASALLHFALWGKIKDWQVRLAIPAILPIASVADKYELAKRMVRGYAGPKFGEALNDVCWSSLDSCEGVSDDAARLADLLTEANFLSNAQLTIPTEAELSEGQEKQDETVASAALRLLTGAQSVRFLQFLARAAHATPALRRRVRLLLSPLSAELEAARIASAVSQLESERDARALFARRFSRGAVGACAAFWVQYQALFGLERAQESRASGSRSWGQLRVFGS